MEKNSGTEKGYSIKGDTIYLDNQIYLDKALEVLRQMSGPRQRKIRKDISRRLNEGFPD